MVDGQQVAAFMHAINPYMHNKLLWRLSKPSESKISECVEYLNAYLKKRYSEDNVTSFTYQALLPLFEWEARIRKEVEKGVAHALPHVQDGDVVFDIGANVGQFSRYLALKRNISVTLFEPVPLYRDYCRLAIAHLPSATVVGKALSDEVGSSTFYIDHTNLGWNTLIGEKQTGGMRAITVETVTLDAYMSEAGVNRVALMKIDVEGAEYRVFKGAHETFVSLEQKPVLLLEIGWGTNHPYREKEVEEFEWLIANGYQRFDYDYPGTCDVAILPQTQTVN